MADVPLVLTITALSVHARAAARIDEQRHGTDPNHVKTSQHNEQTVRGWGGAALLDLEWSSCYTYPRAQKEEYRREYAAEYRRAQAARMAQAGLQPRTAGA